MITEKSTVKTIRLTKSLEKSLEQEARNRKMSLNSFITSLLVKFDEWDRLADKFGMMAIPDDTVMAFLEGLDETQIQIIANQSGATIPRAMMEFWFSRVTPDTFLKYLSLRTNYQHYAKNEIVVDYDNLVLIARHQYGRKWSLWCSSYLAEAIRVNFGVSPRLEITGNSYRIECAGLAKQLAQESLQISQLV